MDTMRLESKVKASRTGNPITSKQERMKVHLKIGGLVMKKSFNQVSDQLERIYKLYCKGFGTRKMLERAENFFFGIQNIGLCF